MKRAIGIILNNKESAARVKSIGVNVIEGVVGMSILGRNVRKAMIRRMITLKMHMQASRDTQAMSMISLTIRKSQMLDLLVDIKVVIVVILMIVAVMKVVEMKIDHVEMTIGLAIARVRTNTRRTSRSSMEATKRGRKDMTVCMNLIRIDKTNRAASMTNRTINMTGRVVSMVVEADRDQGEVGALVGHSTRSEYDESRSFVANVISR